MTLQYECPTLRPTREEFSQNFCQYITKAFKRFPDAGMIKVVPPDGYLPRRDPYPSLDELSLRSPIKQIALGRGGIYRCILVEQKDMSAEEFKSKAEAEGFVPTEKVLKGDDEIMERSFWSGLCTNSPIYGADTPTTLFDKRLPFGWNLRSLSGCLLHERDCPTIPGVTSPMCYIGMYRSFFSWHTEDLDLFSINYLHWGAPKRWYCIPPSNRKKFEDAMRAQFPELYKTCKAFMRHKDVMVSPSQLKSLNIRYTTAKQEPGEFIVLNAGAFHAGFNTGLNCAEAVNFATEGWIEQGAAATRCQCRGDTVDIDMRIFGWESSGSEQEDEEAAGNEEEEAEERSEGEATTSEDRPTRKRARGRRGVGAGRRAAPPESEEEDEDEEASDSDMGVVEVVDEDEEAEGLRRPRTRPAARRKKRVLHFGPDSREQKVSSPSTPPYGHGFSMGRAAAARRPAAPPPTKYPVVAVISHARDDEGLPLFNLGYLIPPSQAHKIEGCALRAGSGEVIVSWLRESRTDGLFRASKPLRLWIVKERDVYAVRTMWDDSVVNPGYRLLTLRSRVTNRLLESPFRGGANKEFRGTGAPALES